jgi:nucleosome binding factor SPN SPT16 subunit
MECGHAGVCGVCAQIILLGATAIVSVVDKPPLVISVDDIELVHFERVVNGGKSFDRSIVFKAVLR